MPTIREFLEIHYRHFNARETLAAARAWEAFAHAGGRMVLALAGAMSTAELGVSLAAAIRAGRIHAISATAANLEEDIFNLISGPEYRPVPHYRDLNPDDEVALREQGFNRVTDVCIPEHAFNTVKSSLIRLWQQAGQRDESRFPYEYVYRLIESGFVAERAQRPMRDSWVVAAYERGLPIYTPGFEDSTLGNMFTAEVMTGRVPGHQVVKPGTEQFEHLIRWYLTNQSEAPMGFFQIGGGIAGDFAICAVPCILQDLKQQCALWSYFAQISDSTTSYGSYSGAVPNEKITWYKLSKDAPRFMIHSDATIVAPLILSYVVEGAGDDAGAAAAAAIGAARAAQEE